MALSLTPNQPDLSLNWLSAHSLARTWQRHMPFASFTPVLLLLLLPLRCQQHAQLFVHSDQLWLRVVMFTQISQGTSTPGYSAHSFQLWCLRGSDILLAVVLTAGGRLEITLLWKSPQQSCWGCAWGKAQSFFFFFAPPRLSLMLVDALAGESLLLHFKGLI